MNKYKNLSNGKTDGIVLFYMKDEKIKPVGLAEEQAEMLDLLLSVPFKDSKLMISKENVNIKDGVVE